MRASARCLVSCAVVATMLLLTHGAGAGDKLAQAKASFAIGARAYEANQFRVAIDAFEEAYRLAPRAAIHFSVAQAYRRQYYLQHQKDDLRQAILHYRQYVADDPKGARTGEASNALADLEPAAQHAGVDLDAKEQTVDESKRPARLLIAPSAKKARAHIDGGPAIKLPERIEVAPGRHAVVVQADGYRDETREVDVGAGEAFALDVHMIEKPAYIAVSAPSDVDVYVDGHLSATTPLAKELEVPAGGHGLMFTRRGFDPVVEDFSAMPGESRNCSPKFKLSSQRIGSFVVFAGAASAAVVGGVFTGLSLSELHQARTIEKKAAHATISPAERDAHDGAGVRRDAFRGAAVGAFSGAAALGVTGALLFVFDRATPSTSRVAPNVHTTHHDDEELPGFTVNPIVAPTLAGLSVDARF